jgi:hypothetical protein
MICPTCHGWRKIDTDDSDIGYGGWPHYIPCPDCHGTGTTPDVLDMDRIWLDWCPLPAERFIVDDNTAYYGCVVVNEFDDDRMCDYRKPVEWSRMWWKTVLVPLIRVRTSSIMGTVIAFYGWHPATNKVYHTEPKYQR